MTSYKDYPRDPKVLKLIAEVDKLLEESGVRAVCNDCWAGKLQDKTHSIGCCSGCELSHPSGCLNKPLSCSLWLCGYTQKLFPKVYKKLQEILKKQDPRLAEPYGQSFRTGSLDFELSRLK